MKDLQQSARNRQLCCKLEVSNPNKNGQKRVRRTMAKRNEASLLDNPSDTEKILKKSLGFFNHLPNGMRIRFNAVQGNSTKLTVHTPI